MGTSSRRKGLEGERQVALMLVVAGLEVRGLESSGDWLCIRPDGRPLHVEVKRAERLKLPEWLRQAAADAPPPAVPIVAFRQNKGDWYAALRLADLLELIR